MPRCNDGDILCPFYIARTTLSITCEGITEDCVTKIMFKSSTKKNLHRKIFCDKNYRNCEIYIMLEKKYEE